MYSKIQQMIAGNIKFLTTQIQPYLDKYQCKNAFDLYTQHFEDMEEKVKVMGYVHRRDAYVTIGNQIASEETSIQDEITNSFMKTIPSSRKQEIIGNAFSREVEKLLMDSDPEILKWADMNCIKDAMDLMEDENYGSALPLIAAIWYDTEIEKLNEPEETPSEPNEPQLA
jgi:hypothetical protein